MLNLQQLKDFADINLDKAMENHEDSTVISVSNDEFSIINPFVSECGRFSVEPTEYYGVELYIKWVRLVNEKLGGSIQQWN